MSLLHGRMSCFGGPDDMGVAPIEGLAIFDISDVRLRSDIFLPQQPEGTHGTARRLNPKAYYLACRWNYRQTPIPWLRTHKLWVTNPKNGRTALAQPVDWGPNPETGRIADLSPGLAEDLGLVTDDLCTVEIPD